MSGKGLGWTTLRGGRPARKDDARLAFGGDLDELGCLLGAALAEPAARRGGVGAALVEAQDAVLAVGCAAACPGPLPAAERRALAAWAARAERRCRELERGLPRLKGFVRPGGGRAAAWLHLARAVCRRAERGAVTLALRRRLPPEAASYLNLLSRLLFAAARRADDRGLLVRGRRRAV